MHRRERDEQAIHRYFDMWVSRDFGDIEAFLAADCIYEECYGPVYCGLAQIRQWIDDQLAKQVVREWAIHEFIHADSSLTGHTVVVTWTFAAAEGEHSYIFDGDSIVHFDANGSIDRIREFEATHQRVHPYA